jgi:hypothetical protein
VSWNDAEDLLTALASLSPQPARIGARRPQVSMIVVDNSVGRLSAAAVHGLWPNTTILVNDNRGFGPANQAARVAAADTLLFVNPDTRAEGEPFSAIARAFADLCVVAVAPRLVEMDGSAAPEGPLRLAPRGWEDQATFQLRRLPTLAADAGEFLDVALAPTPHDRRHPTLAP